MKIAPLFAQRHKYLPLFFLAWVGSIVLIYFLWFPLPQPKADSPYPAFALAAWITFTATTTGAAILRRFRLSYRFNGERLLFAAGLGFAVIAYSVFALGLCHLLYAWAAYALLGLLTVFSYREMRPTAATICYYLKRRYQPTLSDVIFGALLLFLLLYHFLGTLVPPIFFDSLVYHLAMPKLYVLQHGIEYCPYNFYSNFPFTIEMLYTFGLLLQGAILVNGLNYALHLLMLAGLYAFARTYFKHRVALLSLLIFYTVPWVGITSFLLYIDIGLGCYFWLATYALINWVTRQETCWIVLCGVLTGVMLGIKYLAAYGALILGLSVIILATRQFLAANLPRTVANAWRASRPVCYFAMPALLIGAPWYLKSLLWTGNPIYPFIFGGREWDWARLQKYMQEYHYDITFEGFLRLPWDLVFHYDIPLGPIFLAFLPVLLFVRRVPPLIKYLLSASLLFLIFWTKGSAQSRFLIPILPFLSVAAGYAIVEGLAGSGNWLKKIAYPVLVGLLLANIGWELIYVQSTFRPFAVMFGLESKQDYLSRELPTLYPITQSANETLPSDAKILYLGESRGYYADRVFIANTAHDPSVIVTLAHQAKDAADLAARLRALGVTHIIFNKREGTRLAKEYRYFDWQTPADGAKFWEFYQNQVKLLQAVNESELSEVVK